MPTTSDQTSNTAAPIRFIVDEPGIDAELGIKGRGYSPDNGQTFFVQDTTDGRIYRAKDATRLFPLLRPLFDKIYGPVEATLHWADILDKPDLVTESELESRLSQYKPTAVSWSAITGKPDLALRSDLPTSMSWSQITDKPDLATQDDLKNDLKSIDSTAQSTSQMPSDYSDGIFHEVKYISALGIDRSELDVTAQAGTQAFLTTKAYNSYARQTAEVFDSNRPITFIRTGHNSTWNSWEVDTTW